MDNLFYGFGIVALMLYIYEHSSEPATKFKNWLWRKTHKEDYTPPNYDDLPSVYRVPTDSTTRELEPFKEFDEYKDMLFEECNFNPPSGIYTHESEMDDSGSDIIDIYDKEVAQ